MQPKMQPTAVTASAPTPAAADATATMPPWISALPPPLQHKLRVDGLKTRWFSVSPHPEFHVRLVDGGTGTPVSPPMGAAWRVRITARDGRGKLDDGILDPDATSFPVDERGVATIVGLRFRKVTSQCGGHFVCRFLVEAGTDRGSAAIPHVDSAPINVRCQRMKCEGKADGETDLCATDPIGRVKGIGKGYAKKFGMLGFHTVGDLLRLDPSPTGRPARLAVLSQLRKGRGAMTESKLLRYIGLARRVCSKAPAAAIGNDVAMAALSALAENAPPGASKAGAIGLEPSPPPAVAGTQMVLGPPPGGPPPPSHALSAALACSASPCSFIGHFAPPSDDELCSGMLNYSVLEEE